MDPPRTRSQAAAAASRRNGALSQGPRTAEGRGIAAQNARKHGLFSMKLAEPEECSAAALELASYTEQLSGGCMNGAIIARQAFLAAVRSEEAAKLLDSLREELAAKIARDDGPSDEALLSILRQIKRLAGYQRRFRGQRDRALRRLMKEADERQR